MQSRDLEWTVLSWNTQGSKSTDLERVAEVIRAQRPDVVVLQEIRRSQADDLAALLSMNVTWSFKHNALTPFFRDRAEGAAILTPHTLDDPGSTVVSESTSTRSYKRRIVQWAIVARADASAYRVYNVHLSPHDEPDHRLSEASRIAEIAAARGDAPPIIVAGDLNNDGEPAVIATLPGIEHVDVPPTNPSEAPTTHLDHVLLPPDAHSVSVSVPAGGDDWADLSDHLPVTVRFGLDWVQGDFT